MKNRSLLVIMQERIARDEKLLFTTVSFAMILLIFLNLNFSLTPAIGTTASILYFLINGTFLGHAFFEKEDRFLRFMLGNLLLIIFLGLIAWATMIIFYNLDIVRSALVLFIVSTSSSLLNKRMRWKNATI